jgi:hypothetical protein
MLGFPGSELLQWAYGMIVLWYGDLNAPPTGWALCNGTQGTPDMRNRVPIGAGSTYALGATGGATTSAYTPVGTNSAPAFTGDPLAGHSHGDGTLAADSNGAHTHPFTTGAPSATVMVQAGVADTTVATDTHTHSGPTDSDGAHVHTVSGNTSSDSAGTPAGTVAAPAFSGTLENIAILPPYMGIGFIMKL